MGSDKSKIRLITKEGNKTASVLSRKSPQRLHLNLKINCKSPVPVQTKVASSVKHNKNNSEYIDKS